MSSELFNVGRSIIIQRRASVIKEVPHSQIQFKSSHQNKTNENTVVSTTRKPRRFKKSSTTNQKLKERKNKAENKRHKCVSCSMRFQKPSALVIHMRTHSGERPYECTLCNKSFSISGNLRRHMFTHSGEKPYRCTACNRAFNNPSHLARHSKKIHI